MRFFGSRRGSFGERTCFTGGAAPSTRIPFILLIGRTDTSVGYASMTNILAAAVAEYEAGGAVAVSSDADYRHDRYTNADGVVIEAFDHAYETVPDGPWASANGHCIPGSTTDPYAPQYAIPCELPNAFQWGEAVMQFFLAHPTP